MTSHTAVDSQLAMTLRRVAQDMFDRCSIRDLETTLTSIVAAAVDMVPGAAGGGITRTVDEIQVQAMMARAEHMLIQHTPVVEARLRLLLEDGLALPTGTTE